MVRPAPKGDRNDFGHIPTPLSIGMKKAVLPALGSTALRLFQYIALLLIREL